MPFPVWKFLANQIDWLACEAMEKICCHALGNYSKWHSWHTMWACELCTWQSQTGAKSETPRVAMQFANCHKAAIVSNILMQ